MSENLRGLTPGQQTTMRLWQNLEARVIRGGGDLSFEGYRVVDDTLVPPGASIRGGSQHRGPPVRTPLPRQDPLHKFMDQ